MTLNSIIGLVLNVLTPPARRDERGLSQSTVSAHLATLQRAGLVTTRRVGQWIFYKRNEETIKAFLKDIGETL